MGKGRLAWSERYSVKRERILPASLPSVIDARIYRDENEHGGLYCNLLAK